MRKDVEYMLNKEWEPKVPVTEVSKEQSDIFRNKLAGSIRLALGVIVGKNYKNKAQMQTNAKTIN